MCENCDNRVVFKPWKMWVTIAVTLLLFIFSQVFLFGQFTGEINAHIDSDPTYKQLTEEFVTQKELKPLQKGIDDLNAKFNILNNYLLSKNLIYRGN